MIYTHFDQKPKNEGNTNFRVCTMLMLSRSLSLSLSYFFTLHPSISVSFRGDSDRLFKLPDAERGIMPGANLKECLTLSLSLSLPLSLSPLFQVSHKPIPSPYSIFV